MSKTTSPSDSIRPNLDNLEPEILDFIRYFEAEYLKLHSKIAKLQVSDVSKSNQIKAMTAELEKLTKPTQNAIIHLPYNGHGDLPRLVKTVDGKNIPTYYDKKDIEE